MPGILLPKYGYALYVPEAQWIAPEINAVRFSPGHDSRIQSNGRGISSLVHLEIDFDNEIPCDTISEAVEIEATRDPSVETQATIYQSSCSHIPSQTSKLHAASKGIWRWSGDFSSTHDGIYQLTLKPFLFEGQETVRNDLDNAKGLSTAELKTRFACLVAEPRFLSHEDWSSRESPRFPRIRLLQRTTRLQPNGLYPSPRRSGCGSVPIQLRLWSDLVRLEPLREFDPG